jgi:hypothetical protein
MREGERAKLMMAEDDAAAAAAPSSSHSAVYIPLQSQDLHSQTAAAEQQQQQLSAVVPASFNPNLSRPVSGPYVSLASSDYPSRNFNGKQNESLDEVPLVVLGHTLDEGEEEDPATDNHHPSSFGPFSPNKKTAPGSSGSSSSSGYRQRSGWSSCSIGSASVILLIVLSLVVGIPIAIIARRASTEAQQHDASWVDPNATQHRTAFHFQPEQNWMNGQSLLPSLALCVCVCLSLWVSGSVSVSPFPCIFQEFVQVGKPGKSSEKQ